MTSDVYIRIMRAAKAGKGLRLSANDVHDLSLDDAISTRAVYVEHGPPKEEIEHLARSAYHRMTDNDPIIHSNRFPSWSELTEQQRQEWRDKVMK